VLDARRHPLVTVEADQVRVESRLTGGRKRLRGFLRKNENWEWVENSVFSFRPDRPAAIESGKNTVRVIDTRRKLVKDRSR